MGGPVRLILLSPGKTELGVWPLRNPCALAPSPASTHPGLKVEEVGQGQVHLQFYRYFQIALPPLFQWEYLFCCRLVIFIISKKNTQPISYY